MKKLSIILLAIIVISALILGACGGQAPAPAPAPAQTPAPAPTPGQTITPKTQAPAPSPAPAPGEKVKPIVFKLGYDIPPMLPPALGQNWWAEAVTEATEGRVKVEVYPASALVTQQSSLEAIRAGVADMYMMSISSFRKTFPITSIVGLPGVGFPDDTVEANVAHEKTFHEMLAKYPEARAEYDEFGLVFFYIIYSEAYIMSKDKVVRVPADINGMKVGSNGIRMEIVDKLGGASVSDIPPLSYEKLQTGVTEATFACPSAAHDFVLWEVTNHVLDVPFGGGGHPMIVHRATWDKISDHDKGIMIELASEGSRISSKALADLNALAWTEFADFGMITESTAAERALWNAEFVTLWDEYLDECVAAGMSRVDAQSLLDWWKSKSDAAWEKRG